MNILFLLLFSQLSVDQAIKNLDEEKYELRAEATEFLLKQNKFILKRMNEELENPKSFEVKMRCGLIKQKYYEFMKDFPSIWMLPKEERFITPPGTEETVDVAITLYKEELKRLNLEGWPKYTRHRYTDEIPEGPPEPEEIDYERYGVEELVSEDGTTEELDELGKIKYEMDYARWDKFYRNSAYILTEKHFKKVLEETDKDIRKDVKNTLKTMRIYAKELKMMKMDITADTYFSTKPIEEIIHLK